MRKNVKIWFLLVVMLAAAIAPAAVTADVPAAVAYLQAQTPSAWTTMAMAAAGQTGLPADHLKTVSGTLATDYAKTILALAAINQNPATFGNLDYVAKLKTFYNNSQIGDQILINDDIWAMLALAAVKDTASQEFLGAKSFILSHQNGDGGWSYSTAGSSDTNDTAAAVMALMSGGLPATDQRMANAINYLKNAQNDDGGFGYTAADTSDSGSDAWVISAIYKLGENPADWSKNGQNPLTHLQSLQDSDGGFWWQSVGTVGNNKAMTAFAVIALAGKSYPVAYYPADSDSAGGAYHLRLEGQNGVLCDTMVDASSALDIIENAAAACGYTYVITDSAFGRYLSAVNAEAAAGMSGWMYFVNHISPSVGAADYQLQSGDEVLWYYGDWGWSPTRISLDKTLVSSGETVNATIEYFNGSGWLPLPNAAVKVGSETKTGTADGKLQITIAGNGVYEVYVETEGFVRSEKKEIQVGAEVSQNVALTVEVDQSGGPGNIHGDAIGLAVTPNQLNFGKLKPGQASSQNLLVTNTGTADLHLGSTVSGNAVFTGSLKIDGAVWSAFASSLTAGQNKTVAVNLSVPASYLEAGVKNGELIIWATAN